MPDISDVPTTGRSVAGDAADERDHARGLLNLAGAGRHVAVEIDTLLHGCKPGNPLPDRDTVARRIRAGVRASASVTVAEYLTGWLAGRRGLAEKTVRGYADHIHKYLIPHLGKIGLQDLRARTR